MIILGIDPGFDRCGYGVVRVAPAGLSMVGAGLVTTPRTAAIAERLTAIVSGVTNLIDKHRPDSVAIEQLFFLKNQKSVMRVSQAMGAIIVAVTQQGIPVAEYTPLQVKQALSGYGQATKSQVQNMVERLLKLDRIAIDDTADALAVAICHSQTVRLAARIKKQLAH